MSTIENRMGLHSESQTFDWKKLLSRIYPYILMMIFASLIIIPEITHGSYTGGLDSYFHMNGFYEAAMQIRHNNYSYFLSLYGFDRSARVVNAIYAPGFNYLMGELLLLCGSWVKFNIISSFLVLSISGFGLYMACRCMSVNKAYSIILAALYMMSHPVMSWVGNQEFTGIGSMLLPFVFIVGIKIAQSHKIKIAPLVVLMTVLLQTHLLTSLMAVIVLIPYTLFGFVKSNHKNKMTKCGLLSAVIVLFLNSNVFASLVDLFSSNYLIPTFPQFTTQANGVKIQGLSITDVGAMTTILFILTTLIIVIFCMKFRGIDVLTLVTGLVWLWISSYYFPWSSIEERWIGVTNTVQFPQRFMALFWIPLLISAGVVMTKISKQPGLRGILAEYTSVAILTIIFLISFGATLDYTSWLPTVWNSNKVVRYKDSDIYLVKNPNKLRSAFRSHHLSKAVGAVKKQTPDYLPVTKKVNLKQYYKLPIYTDVYKNLQFSKFKCHRHATPHELHISWNGKKAKDVIVPAVKYNHTEVKFNGEHVNPSITYVGAIKVHQQKGLNTMTLKYEPSLFFKIAIFLMIVSWIGLLSFGVKCLISDCTNSGSHSRK